jgi:hypothetical protein
MVNVVLGKHIGLDLLVAGGFGFELGLLELDDVALVTDTALLGDHGLLGGIGLLVVTETGGAGLSVDAGTGGIGSFGGIFGVAAGSLDGSVSGTGTGSSVLVATGSGWLTGSDGIEAESGGQSPDIVTTDPGIVIVWNPGTSIVSGGIVIVVIGPSGVSSSTVTVTMPGSGSACVDMVIG